MADEERIDGGGFQGGGFAALLSNHIGETITIFTSSGGESGSGFTGVILSVNPVFVRLITRIGPPPGCSLGNACSDFNVGHGYPISHNIGPASYPGAVAAGGWDGFPVYTVGSITDIPIAAIVSFVHNAV